MEYAVAQKLMSSLSNGQFQTLADSWNKLMHILYGNRKLGYNIGFWNCRKGLLSSNNEASEKLTNIKSLLYGQNLDLLGLVECDLHSKFSRVKRCNPTSTESLMVNLHIGGYILKLPMSWYSHGQARIIMYVKEGVNIRIKPMSQNDCDLPSISCEIKLGKEAQLL